MSFESTYQLVSPIADSPDALSYRAVIKMTGEEVWVHIVRPDASAVFELAKKQFAAASFGERQILEVVQEGVKSYVVTKPLPAGAGFLDWLKSLGQAKTPDPLTQAGAFKFSGFTAPPPSPPIAATQEMPTFTMPMPPVAPSAPPPQPEPAPPPAFPPPAFPPPAFPPPAFPPPAFPPPAPPPPVPQAAPAMGEFTRMFQTPRAPQAPQAPAFAPPPAQTSKDPGEFTRMFQSPLMDHTPSPVNPITNPIAPPPSQQAGEFTRMFKAVNAPSVLPPPNAPPPGPPAPGPGDFTRLLQTPSAASMGTAASPLSSPPPFGGGTSAPPAPMPQFNSPATPPAFQQSPPPLAAPQFAPPPSQPNPAPGAHGQYMPPPPAPSGSSARSPFQQSPIGTPSYSAPSVSLPGMSAPSISSSGQINGPYIGTPSFSAGNVSGPSLYSGGSFSLDDLPGFGPGSGQPANVTPQAAGPLSAGSAPMNPNALSKGDGATGFFKSPQPAAHPQTPQAPPQAGPGDYTRMMQAPPAASAPAVGVPVPKSNTPPPAQAPLFSQPVVPGAAPAPPAVPAAVPVAAPGGFLKGISPWLIVGNVIVVLMVVALVYVIVKSSR